MVLEDPQAKQSICFFLVLVYFQLDRTRESDVENASRFDVLLSFCLNYYHIQMGKQKKRSILQSRENK